MLAKPTGIPRESGCYLFRNERGTIIYVGKARVLAQRLSSYFQRESGLSEKTQLLMNEATSVEWIVTPNEVDALILENELIKANQPRYNMRLKDDKSFPFVALDYRTPFAAPYLTRGQHVKGVRYFGPFVDVRAVRATMDELLQAFPLRSCSKHKFQYQQRIGRPCLLYDIGKCSGPCVGKIDTEGYVELLELLGAILRRRRACVARPAACPDARSVREPALRSGGGRARRTRGARTRGQRPERGSRHALQSGRDRHRECRIARGHRALSGAPRSHHRAHGAPGGSLHGRG